VYAFTRIDRDEKIEYIVAFNNAEAESAASVPTYYAAGTQFDLLTTLGAGSPPAVLTTGASGSIDVTVPALGLVIYKAAAPAPASPAAPSVTITKPATGQEVILEKKMIEGHVVVDRLEVAADVAGQGPVEVTFAVKINDGEYTPIGTDNNPPYRVFYDVTTLPAGATLSFKTIVDDLSGHLNGAKVTGVTPVIQEPTQPPAATGYAVVHYLRPDGDYGDHTTGNSNDFWGLHAWGDIEGTVDWTAPIPFAGEDEYGRFAWLKLAAPAQNIGIIVHRGDVKDGADADRFFNPSANPEIWLKADDPTIYTSQAAAQGFATIHYRRADGDYTGWGLHLWGEAIDPSEATDWATPKPPTGEDDFGAYWNVQLADETQPLNFIIHRGDEKDPGPDQSFIPADDASVWIMSGDETIYSQRGAALGVLTLHYRRPASDYGDYASSNYLDFWGLHTWGDAEDPGWTTPRKPARFDTFGAVFEVPLFPDAAQVNYILHRGDTKDPGPDQSLSLDKWGYEVWQLQGADVEAPYILPILQAGGPQPGNLSEARAYWVSADTIAWDAAETAANTFKLCYAPDGGLQATDAGVTGGECLDLAVDPAGLPADVREKFPHLADLPALKIAAADLGLVPEILKGQFAVSALTPAGVAAGATGLQIPGVLDDLYTYDGPLGVRWESGRPVIRLWGPTAKSVALRLYNSSNPADEGQALPMETDPDTGVWSLTGQPNWKGKFYLFEVQVYAPSTGQVERNQVTDPYSLSLSTNSLRSQIVNLRDAALKPAGWDWLAKPPLAAPEDISIYELHVRDFSAYDASVPAALRGTFRAFALGNSYGIQHLKALRTAGLTHLHLLPAFDFATINEDKSTWQSPNPATLATFPSDSDEQQAAVAATAEQDPYNWGYDPLHYTVPEGSYSTNPNGATRILEFRQMVQALNRMGLRVVMDVVYNHTHAAGQDPKAVLDRIVPGYYHRLDEAGAVTTSTCCSNTASEHNMMEKLMVDSLVTWATQYKVDGFRFDLMGHHMLRNMEKVRATLDALTVAKDGVDGKSIYLYGEGWNFGEVADGARGENATQLNLAGTGIGTFNDRGRDAVRGIGPFDTGDGLLQKQGFANGMYYDPKPTVPGTSAEQLAQLLLQSDQIRVGLAGNLADYSFIDRFGELVTGAEVDYNGAPAGYTRDPQEDISYVEAHDNQTLFDINILAAPQDTSLADRVRMQIIGLSTIIFGQGIPFIHAGSELLRSKSLDRDSYNSGDWFNALDFTFRRNGFGIGLPPAARNEGDWAVLKPFLADTSLKPGRTEIMLADAMTRDLLRIRYSSKLFRLRTAEDVQRRLQFWNTGPDQLPGLIVMSVSDRVDPDLDPRYERLVTLINANDGAQTIAIPALAGVRLHLHDIQRKSADRLVRTARYDWRTGTFYVPARTAVVFFEAQKGR
jgi:pullulanase-type alpha-1,6-glucosidase